VERVKSILVVDDDPMFAKLLEEILTGEGYGVTTAANGVEALVLLANQAFDLLMIDIRMPELDGPSFYRELERSNPDQARRVMFMTGGGVGPETAELLSTVRTPVLRKPLAVKDVRDAVQRFFLAVDSFRRRS
jgi:CheY-like chemotaxis protein